MKIVIAKSGKRTLKMSRKEWETIGESQKWLKSHAASIRLVESVGGDCTEVYVGNAKEPRLIIDGCSPSLLDKSKIVEYVRNVDWTDLGAKGWMTPRLRPDDFML